MFNKYKAKLLWLIWWYNPSDSVFFIIFWTGSKFWISKTEIRIAFLQLAAFLLERRGLFQLAFRTSWAHAIFLISLQHEIGPEMLHYFHPMVSFYGLGRREHQGDVLLPLIWFHLAWVLYPLLCASAMADESWSWLSSGLSHSRTCIFCFANGLTQIRWTASSSNAQSCSVLMRL